MAMGCENRYAQHSVGWAATMAMFVVNLVLLGALSAVAAPSSTGGGTWRTCSGGVDLLVAVTARETWTESEKHCQQAGGHLAVVDPTTVGAACLTDLAALAGVQAHFGITASLDDSFRSLPDYNSRSSLLQFNILDRRCAAVSVASNGARTISTTSCIGEPRRPYICQRYTATPQIDVSVACNNKEYIYHPIAFSRQHAADTCKRLYTGSQLADTTQSDINCMQQLLSLQSLVSRDLGQIEVYTATQETSSFAGTRCAYWRASNKVVTLRPCQQTSPVVCVRSPPDPSTTAQQPSTTAEPSETSEPATSASWRAETTAQATASATRHRETNAASTAHTGSPPTRHPAGGTATSPEFQQTEGPTSVPLDHGTPEQFRSAAGRFMPSLVLPASFLLAFMAL
ncbi:mucin-5AC-like [Sycon ciliatum]|uniref:mucin-5AC-like n=1 Tax=Sycon ciliatum TaxID=27933 RepID=UPI0031F64C76